MLNKNRLISSLSSGKAHFNVELII